MKTILPFDDFVLNRSDNTKRIFKQPEWKPELAYYDPYNPRGASPSSFVRAPQGGVMMIYLGTPDLNDPMDDEHLTVFHAYSKDGLHFEPYKELNPGAEYPHKAGLLSDEIGVGVIEDLHETDPRYRYKAPCAKYGYKNGKLIEDNRTFLLASPDLIHWERYNDASLTPSYVDCSVSLLYNPVTESYQATTRRRWGERRICLVESKDLKSWTLPHAIVHPLPGDEPTTHLYSMPHFYYEPGEIFIGFLWKQIMPFHRIMEGPVSTEYAYSYDGIMWNRTNADLFPQQPRGAYGSGMSFVVGMIDRGEDIVFYSRAAIHEHSMPSGYDGSIMPGTVMIPGVLKKNRFVAIDSGKGKGELVTQWLRLKKPELHINANVPFGSLRAELLADGRAIEGFGFDDFEPIRGDSTDFPLRWKGDLRALAESGRWFELHIVFDQAEVYAITGDFDFTINTRGPVYDRL